MNSRQFANTSSNMVQEVKNIIEGYDMGSLRALAQEPVQNALDAVRPGRKTVEVEYRLLRRHTAEGNLCYLLTVTDSGTTGLRGPMVSDEELEGRHFKLKADENWAAFEAQGYTKENEDALGSRGQGKAAFLYHSYVPGETRRMLMLYDTFLENSEYRFGIRFARPVDQRLKTPLLDDEAQAAAQDSALSVGGELTVPLGLAPLREVGTRVIVPFLEETSDVPKLQPYSELSGWLQRCWWRAIQTGKLKLRIVDEEQQIAEEISVPSWWQDLPRVQGKSAATGNWRDIPGGGRACIWRELPLDGGYQIRQLALLHSAALEEDEITHDHPEYAGIQVLRGSQWIETRGTREEYGDFIPVDKRPGFRGYVEFDKATDSALRASEKPQHDGYNGRHKTVRLIRAELKSRVREFSETMGWALPQAATKQQVSQREKSTHSRFLQTFLNPNGHKPKSGNRKGGTETPQLVWDCRLDLEYPDPKSARVDWGQLIRNVYVWVGFEPDGDLAGSADLILEWLDDSGKAQEIYRQDDAIRKQWNEDSVQQKFELGDWTILRGKASRERQIECPEPGECRLRAVVEYHSERVTRAERTVYVQTEPPPPPKKNPVTLSISAENISAGNISAYKQKRVDHSQVLHIQINARNRRLEDGTFYLTATFANEIFARDEAVTLIGTPAGDSPRRQCLISEKRQLLDPQQSAPLFMLDGVQHLKMPDSSGVYRVSAELTDSNGESIAVASRPVYFQRDPGNARNNLPFGIGQEDQKEMWKMNADLTKLTYPQNYPLYKELPVPQRQHRALQANLAFIAEISANGLLEWALRPKEQGDDSNYDQLHDESRALDNALWDDLNRGLEDLSKTVESPTDFAQTWRATVAIMLEIFEEENG